MLNETILIGRLTRDPQLSQANTGDEVVHFTLAVNRQRAKKPDGTFVKQKQNADFIPCVAWQGKAKAIVDNCKKGSKIAIKGPVRSRVVTLEDNSTRTIVEIKVIAVEFLDPKNKDGKAAADEVVDEMVGSDQEMDDLEIPL